MLLRDLLRFVSPGTSLWISEPGSVCRCAFRGKASQLVNKGYEHLPGCSIRAVFPACDTLHIELNGQ